MISPSTLKQSTVLSGLTILLLAAFAITSIGFPSNAHAKKINVEFDDLQVTQQRDRLLVDYTIRSKDWRKIRKHNITPTLELYTANNRRRRSTTIATERLHNRSGTLVIRRANLSPRADVFVELNGTRGRRYINRVEYGRQRGSAIQLAVRQTNQRPHYNNSRPTHRNPRNTRPVPVGPPRTTRSRTVVVHQPAPRPVVKPRTTRKGISISIGL